MSHPHEHAAHGHAHNHLHDHGHAHGHAPRVAPVAVGGSLLRASAGARLAGASAVIAAMWGLVFWALA